MLLGRLVQVDLKTNMVQLNFSDKHTNTQFTPFKQLFPSKRATFDITCTQLNSPDGLPDVNTVKALIRTRSTDYITITGQPRSFLSTKWDLIKACCSYDKRCCYLNGCIPGQSSKDNLLHLLAKYTFCQPRNSVNAVKGITLRLWLGKPLTKDVTIGCPLANSCGRSSPSSWLSSRAAAACKSAKYVDIEFGYIFQAIATESLRPINKCGCFWLHFSVQTWPQAFCSVRRWQEGQFFVSATLHSYSALQCYSTTRQEE